MVRLILNYTGYSGDPVSSRPVPSLATDIFFDADTSFSSFEPCEERCGDPVEDNLDIGPSSMSTSAMDHVVDPESGGGESSDGSRHESVGQPVRDNSSSTCDRVSVDATLCDDRAVSAVPDEIVSINEAVNDENVLLARMAAVLHCDNITMRRRR